MKILFSFSLLLFFSLEGRSAIIKQSAKHFKEVGYVSQFSWAPESYPKIGPHPFTYDVLYYVPKSLKNTKGAKALLFLHGGGKSTLTRKGSLDAAKLYIYSDLHKLADALNMVVVVPSASGLNWNGHTYTMIRSLVRLMRQELEIDPNHIGLSGHSMGGMAITRNYVYLVDEFAYFLPMAAGMDERLQTEENLTKLFDVPYVHLQGRSDLFQEFVRSCQEQIQKVRHLEVVKKTKSLFQVLFHKGDHQINYNLTLKILRPLSNSSRNVYRKTIHGVLNQAQAFKAENGIVYKQESADRYYWIKVLRATSAIERLDFEASIKNNEISLNFSKRPKSIQAIRIYLSRKLIDFGQDVHLTINGISWKTYSPNEKTAPFSPDSTDPSFVFDDFIDVDLNDFYESQQK